MRRLPFHWIERCLRYGNKFDHAIEILWKISGITLWSGPSANVCTSTYLLSGLVGIGPTDFPGMIRTFFQAFCSFEKLSSWIIYPPICRRANHFSRPTTILEFSSSTRFTFCTVIVDTVRGSSFFSGFEAMPKFKLGDWSSVQFYEALF